MIGSAHPQGGNKMGSNLDECVVYSSLSGWQFETDETKRYISITNAGISGDNECNYGFATITITFFSLFV